MTRLATVTLAALLATSACKEEELDASGDAELGSSCDAEAEQPECKEGLSCESVAGTQDDHVCAATLEIRGQVIDAITEVALEGALVAALDETGAPVTNVAVSDADGLYTLAVPARRDPSGHIVEALKWTLFATAQDYQPFPAGVRPAIPVNAQDAQDAPLDPNDDSDDAPVLHVIENASTAVALIRLPESERVGITVSGDVGEAARGALVVAEGGPNAPYAIADASGAYTMFNVPDAASTIVAYRQGIVLEPGNVDAESDLATVERKPGDMAVVSGSVNIVNAPGGSQTSVVLVPVSVFNDVLERGPVPFGLRAPGPPAAPEITSGFTIEAVPPGTYKVLAAFENDDLVRDPDEGIAGTAILEITVGEGGPVTVSESFKVTEDIAVVGPGADVPEVVTAPPTLVWADDSSEDFYEVVVYDALGDVVWENLDVPRVTGGSTVEVPYEGPALTPGMYYQFRATSFRDGMGGASAISRTEDLRGVFVFRDAE